MAQSVIFNGTEILHPGVYTKTNILQVGGFPLTGASIVGIVGEAVGGAPGSTDGYQLFGSSQMSDIADKYRSGPIVEACRALINPGRDNRVPGGADYIKIYKTNASTQATAAVQNMSNTTSDIFDITSKNYGAEENLIYFYISEGTVADRHCSISSSAITFPITFVGGDTLVLTVNGVNYTYTVAASAGAKANVAAVLTALNNAGEWAPSKPVVASAGTVANTVTLELDNTNAALDEYNAMHEYSILSRVNIGATSAAYATNLAAANKLDFLNRAAFNVNGSAIGTFGVAASTVISEGMVVTIDDDDTGSIQCIVTDITGTAPNITVQVDNGLTDLSAYTIAQNAYVYGSGSVLNTTTLALTEGPAGPARGYRGTRIWTAGRNTEIKTLSENNNSVMLRIWYVGAGTACTMTIQDVASVRKLTTTVTAGPGGEALDIILANYTIQELCDYINNFGAATPYIAYAVYGAKASQTGEILDYYNAIDVRTMPLEVKAINWEMLTIVNTYSNFIEIELQDNIYGAVETIASTSKEYLSGAIAGASSNTDFQNGFDALLKTRCTTVIPLISQDATDDVADGVTDSGSTYTIDSVNLMTDSHCRTASNTKNRSERNCYVSYLSASFADCRTASETLNSEYTSMAIQEVQDYDVEGNVIWKQPYMLGCYCAGMQSGMDVGSPITFKQPNILGLRHDDFDWTDPSDVDLAIKSGLLVVEEPDVGGFRVVVGNTTYMSDANSVFNRISVMEAAHYVAYNLRQQIESLYIGNKMSSVDSSAESVKSTVIALMSKFLADEIIVGDDTNGGLGYKGLSVRIDSNIIYIDITITPVVGIDFVLATLAIDTIKATATSE